MVRGMAAKKPPAKRPVFTRDEMSTGKGSKLVRRAATALSTGTGALPTPQVDTMKPKPPDAVRDEIRFRERASTAAIVGPVLAKQKAAPADLFAKRKMKEAEANLPDWNAEGFDDEVYPEDEVAEEVDPDKTDPGLDKAVR
jgi:pyocin large subunit-like protein